MAEAYLRLSALAHLGLEARAVADPGEAGVVLSERPGRGQIDLRGEAEDAGFLGAVEQAIGLALPLAAGATASGGAATALWLGPNEWLVVTPPDGQGAAAEALRAALKDLWAAVTDVSDSRAVIGLSGRHAREVLMKGCSLDLHPRVFGPGRSAQSAVARALVLLHQTDEAPSYDLYVHRSFAEYLWLWLEDAAEEYGLAVVSGG